MLVSFAFAILAASVAEPAADSFNENNPRGNALERMDTRRVDYSLSMVELQTFATDLEVDPPSADPEASDFDIIIDNAASADHETQVLTMTCRSYRVANPASEILIRTLTHLDRDGDLTNEGGDPVFRIDLDNAATIVRCVMRGDLDARCIARTTLGAVATYRDANGVESAQPIYTRTEIPFDSDGFCGGMTLGTGYVTREATIAFAARLWEIHAGLPDAEPVAGTPAATASEPGVSHPVFPGAAVPPNAVAAEPDGN